jgi:hypothetical protein
MAQASRLPLRQSLDAAKSRHPTENTAFKISAEIAGNYPANRYPVPKKGKTGASGAVAPSTARKPLRQRNLQITLGGREI